MTRTRSPRAARQASTLSPTSVDRLTDWPDVTTAAHLTFLDSKSERQALAAAASAAEGSGVAHAVSSGVGGAFLRFARKPSNEGVPGVVSDWSGSQDHAARHA